MKPAFVNSDAELAEKAIFNDNVVDDMYEQILSRTSDIHAGRSARDLTSNQN